MFSMRSISTLLLLIIIPAALVFLAWLIARFGAHAFRNRMPSPESAKLPQSVVQQIETPGVSLAWISLREFKALFARFSDLIVINLREDAGQTPFPIPEVEFVVPIQVHELVELLELVPANRVVVFYGISDFSKLLIETSSFMQRPAPSFALDTRFACLEVA